MVNYNNGKIYKIVPNCDHEENEIYIGSTTKKYLSQRMDAHRSNYKSWKEGKRNKVMSFQLFDKYGVDNCKIILIEIVNCNTKDELFSRESFYIKSLNCINKQIMGRTKKEYYNDNIDKIKKYKKEINKIKHICICGKEYTIDTNGAAFSEPSGAASADHKTRHERTNFHLNFLQNNNN